MHRHPSEVLQIDADVCQQRAAVELGRLGSLQGQRAILSSLSDFSVHAEIKHAVNSGGGERVAIIEMTFSRDGEGPRVRGEVDFLSLNGDTLDVSERKRIQRSLSAMMTPEIGPMLNEYILPIQSRAGLSTGSMQS